MKKLEGTILTEDKGNRYKLIISQADFETAIMELYDQFAEQYSYCSLWRTLSEEEKKHSSWLKGLAAKLKAGEVGYENCSFLIEKVQKAVKTIRDFVEKIKMDPISITEAFLYAEKIENSLYEKEYLTYFETDSETLKSTIEILIQDSEKHRDMIILEASKYKI